MRGRNAPGGFHRLAKGEYHKLSIAEKQGLVRGGERESPVACPHCGTKTDACDLLAHIDVRCSGPQEPKTYWRWVDWRHARGMGVPAGTLSRWANNGQVRYTGGRMDRKYLLRDLAMKIAQRRGFRRR